MNGDPDAGYALPRRVLLDALEALREHLPALILVGAQAVYLQTSDVRLAVSPHTTDADLTLDPRLLAPRPSIRERMVGANFVRRAGSIGVWEARSRVTIDLLVPAALSPAGRRAARLGDQGDDVARKTAGLEAVVVDNDLLSIMALDPDDSRSFELAVAGPAALLVAKLHKISERLDTPGRAGDKDALDVYRLLLLSSAGTAERYARILAHPLSADVARSALGYLRDLFGSRQADGARMAARALIPYEDPDTVAASCAVLVEELLSAIRHDA